MPKVSVIIPTYNRSQLLERAVRSVLAQTFRDFEVIVVDDDSTDNTAEVIESKFAMEVRTGTIRYVKNERRMERSFTRNRGMEMARGEYMSFLDDDDLFLPDHLKILLPYLDENKEVGCIFSNYIKIYDNEPIALGVKKLGLYKEFSYRELCILGILAATCSAMFRREAYKKIGGLREDLTHGENSEFYMRIALNYPVHYIDVITSCQYIHRGCYSHISPGGRAYNKERIWRIVEENSIKYNFPLRKELVGKAYINISWSFLSLPDIMKSREYLFKAIRADHGLLIKSDTLRLLVRIILGKHLYFLFKKLRSRF